MLQVNQNNHDLNMLSSVLISRIIHAKRSFWTAKDECEALGGQLLPLDQVPEVIEALGSSMVGNVDGDFRIDGWSSGIWYEGDENGTISADDSLEYALLSSLKHATLTVNLQDGMVSGNAHVEAHLGSVCQAPSGVGLGNTGCQQTTKGVTTQSATVMTMVTTGSVDMTTHSGVVTNSSAVATSASVELATTSAALPMTTESSGLCQKSGFIAGTKDVAYKILDQALGKDAALVECISTQVGGHSLARVHTKEEMDALLNMINGNYGP